MTEKEKTAAGVPRRVLREITEQDKIKYKVFGEQ